MSLNEPLLTREPQDAVPKRRSMVPLLVVAVLAIAGGSFGWLQWSGQNDELERARGALELQVLTSRLGVAAIQVEYGNFEDAGQSVRAVFDGVVNYGIEHNALPENYARVLAARDEVVVGLAQRSPDVATELVRLFFLLQLPADTELDSRYIIPATDSGRGMAPPTRHEGGATISQSPPADTMRARSPMVPDTATTVIPHDRPRP